MYSLFLVRRKIVGRASYAPCTLFLSRSSSSLISFWAVLSFSFDYRVSVFSSPSSHSCSKVRDAPPERLFHTWIEISDCNRHGEWRGGHDCPDHVSFCCEYMRENIDSLVRFDFLSSVVCVIVPALIAIGVCAVIYFAHRNKDRKMHRPAGRNDERWDEYPRHDRDSAAGDKKIARCDYVRGGEKKKRALLGFIRNT